jgi:hypothetical protein
VGGSIGVPSTTSVSSPSNRTLSTQQA